jgi:hypothetical protein
MSELNNCPCRDGCERLRKYQRDAMLRQLVESMGSLRRAAWLLGCDQAPVGHEFQFALVRQIRRLGVAVPRSKSALAAAVRSAPDT